MAISFSKINKPATPEVTTPAPAPTEAVQQTLVEPEVLTPESTAVILPGEQDTALSLFNGEDATAALAAMTEGDGSKRAFYPTLDVSGGDTGGSFVPSGYEPEEVADQMPQGKKPVPVVFLGYRTQAYAWATSGRAPGATAAGGKKQPPVWRCAIPGTAAADTALIKQAVENYTFKKKHEKEAFDFEKSGIGHIKVEFQALVFCPEFGALLVLQSVPVFKSWRGTADSVLKLVDPATRRWTSEPVLARIRTTEEKGAEAWKLHTIMFELMPEAEKAKHRAAVLEFAAAMRDNKEEQQKAHDWLTCAGCEMTDAIREKLKQAAAL